MLRGRGYRRLFLPTIALVVVLLAGCARSATELKPIAPALVVAEAPAAILSQEGGGEATAPAAAPAAVDDCLLCHVDKERLIATAAPEEEVIVENEGEG
jgi:hypothetical protein